MTDDLRKLVERLRNHLHVDGLAAALCDWCCAATALELLAAENEALWEDRERLDWIEYHRAQFAFLDGGWYYRGDVIPHLYPTLTLAIDAARREEKP